MKAIEILYHKNRPYGFFLFVEGGLIDQAHHDNMHNTAFAETVDLSNAVEQARLRINMHLSLIVVTADHSNTMVYANYKVCQCWGWVAISYLIWRQHGHISINRIIYKFHVN